MIPPTDSTALVTAAPRRPIAPWLVGLGFVTAVILFRQALLLGAAAFALAYALAPLVRRLQRLGLPRPAAIALVLLLGFAVVGSVVSVLGPALVHQLEGIVRKAPAWLDAIQHRWIPYLRHDLHLRIPSRTEDVLSQLGLRASSVAPRIGTLVNDTLAYTLVVLEAVATTLIVFAVAFYVLLDFEIVLARAFSLVPHRARIRTLAILREIDDTLRQFLSGQLVVMVTLGWLYALALSLLDVPAGWAVGVFAGMISFVPYLGFLVALVLALFMTALDPDAGTRLVAVAVVMNVVHLLDATLLTPRIVGGRTRLHPAVVILALVGGGSAFGIAGFLVAIPVASIARILVREIVRTYQSTAFFLRGSAPSALETTPLAPAPADVRTALGNTLLHGATIDAPVVDRR